LKALASRGGVEAGAVSTCPSVCRARVKEVAMDRAGLVRAPARVAPGPPLRMLSETAVAVQYTLGTGGEEDNRALDRLERAVWLELALACPDRREREYLIEEARGAVAAPGIPSCRHAVRLLINAGAHLLMRAGHLDGEERARVERCAVLCGEGAVRLKRIVLDSGGV
jgi:hypothetical protein